MTREWDYRRLNEKETDYRLRRRGLGIRDAIKRHTAATSKSDTFGQFFFRAIIKVAPLTKFAPTDWLIKKVAMMGGTKNTKGYSVPLYVETAEPVTRGTRRIELNQPVMREVKPVHPPVELIQDAVRRASYRAIMHECLCRKIQGCTDYPIDLGCLFIGPAAKACVERGIAHVMRQRLKSVWRISIGRRRRACLLARISLKSKSTYGDSTMPICRISLNFASAVRVAARRRFSNSGQEANLSAFCIKESAGAARWMRKRALAAVPVWMPAPIIAWALSGGRRSHLRRAQGVASA